ncbi:UNVERIFIED_CONTAM: hypothetical protein FKN15_009269 [Acipenser sinensis]
MSDHATIRRLCVSFPTNSSTLTLIISHVASPKQSTPMGSIHNDPILTLSYTEQWDKDTFVRAQCWLQELERQYIAGETVVALVGNKADLSDLRQVELQEAQNLAEKKGLLFMETSAKSGKKVSELFVAIAHRLLQNADDGRTSLMHWSNTRVDLHVPESQESRESRESCCRL